MKLRRQLPSIQFTFPVLCLFLVIFSNGCKKTTDLEPGDQLLSDQGKPPRPPVYFYFTNCSHPAITGNFVAGAVTTATVTLQYINSPGGAYPAYTSNLINGVRLTAPAGNLASGSGSILLNAVGTPVNSGSIAIPVSIKGSITCNVPITVLNAPPPPGNCTSPGAAIGSKGCVTFTYRGQQVTYTTVRAADGKIWIQQNLGSPQVAVNGQDIASFGHYFQWGRWDDGHQLHNSGIVTGSASLRNPSNIPSGNSNFIIGASTSTSWWGMAGNATNTWSGTSATSTNGKDPCVALGAGWHMPSASEWNNVVNAEYISDAVSAFQSNLRLTESGYRNSPNGAWTPNFVGGYYWSSTAGNTNTANNLFFDNAYNLFVTQTGRGYGFNCRCVKN